MTDNKETYLGDGLYASFDGCQFRLRVRHIGGAEVYLEPEVYEAFVRYASKCLKPALTSAVRGKDRNG